MKPYLWMVDYTPQREWIEQRGLLLLSAFFFSEAGAGIYLVSIFLHFPPGWVAGWIVSTVLGGVFHLLYLGKPLRAWRAVLRPGKSELSRGMIVMVFFSAVGVLHIAPSLASPGSLPWQSEMLPLQVAMTVLCLLVIVHGFLTMSVVSAIPSWNSGVLPLLAVASGVWLGSQVAAAVSLAVPGREILAPLEAAARWSLFAYTLLVVSYLWSAHHSIPTRQESFRVIVKDDLAPLFYAGVILIGLILPLAVTFLFWAGEAVSPLSLLPLRIICAVVGDFTLRYVIFKAGRYAPFMDSNVLKEKRNKKQG